MAHILELDPACVSKIAAGEVIERPASVVKELLENSIDAGSTEIRLLIINGGKDLIEVKDNGTGIKADELPLALRRHSTSKIRSERDLDSIKTMGFRGEALYSIASVSKIVITSKTEQDEVASILIANGDINNYSLTETAMPSSGTIVQIKDLFFNYNVRRKFLKSALAEESPIFNIISQYAIAFPNISFTYIKDNKIEFQTFKGQLRITAIKNVFGKEFADSLIDMGIIKRGKIEIQGYLSRSGYHRRNRKYQFFYVNNRRIHSKILQTALEEGFGSYLMKQEFPIAFLFLELDPKEFDVNIHPQKKEIQFYEEEEIQRGVKEAVSYCLKAFNIIPSFKPSSITSSKQTQLLSQPNIKSISQNKSIPNEFHQSMQRSFIPTELMVDDTGYNMKASKKGKTTINLFGSQLRYRGMLGNEFVLLEDTPTNDLVILDFHASHERINLERLQKELDLNQIKSQTFIQPFRFDITPEQKNIIKPHLNLLNDLGFDIRIPHSNDREIFIHAIPSILSNQDLRPFLIEFLDTLPEKLIEDQLNTILSIIACHSSYRAGQSISYHQTATLLKELSETENPTICAHGRPTHFRITYKEMLKQIRRI